MLHETHVLAGSERERGPQGELLLIRQNCSGHQGLLKRLTSASGVVRSVPRITAGLAQADGLLLLIPHAHTAHQELAKRSGTALTLRVAEADDDFLIIEHCSHDPYRIAQFVFEENSRAHHKELCRLRNGVLNPRPLVR